MVVNGEADAVIGADDPAAPAAANPDAAAAGRADRGNRNRHINTMIVLALVVCAFILSIISWEIEVRVQKVTLNKQQRKQSKEDGGSTQGDGDIGDNEYEYDDSKTHTEQYSLPTNAEQLHLKRLQSSASGSTYDRKTAAEAYWNQAVHLLELSSWDPTISDPLWSPSSSLAESLVSSRIMVADDVNGTNNNHVLSNAGLGMQAILAAAELGHAGAQYLVGNALAAGFWPVQDQSEISPDSLYSSISTPMEQFKVQDSVLQSNPQQNKAMLYWHMAAMGGNVEAAMAVLHRLELQQAESKVAPNSGNIDDDGMFNNKNKKQHEDLLKHRNKQCLQRLPYAEAAAAGIIDRLEADPASRAKVTPASDKHLLHQVHLHGGQGSRLEYHNRPDESAEALQFYHVKAHQHIEADASDRRKSEAPQAAFTLAQFYHHGIRGVTQNVTLAAEYYEIAALQRHWEAAGQVGLFYLWGIGVEQDFVKAHKFFNIGMPVGLDNCQSRFDRKARQKRKKNNRRNDGSDYDSDDDNGVSIHLCDDNSLNGMGLLKLFGAHPTVDRNVDDANQMFQLAKNQGNTDASYNLAMMKLGWKTHWKSVDQLDPDGRTEYDPNDPFQLPKVQSALAAATAKRATEGDKFDKAKLHEQLLEAEKKVGVSPHHLSRGEYEAALKLLMVAADKKHVQARHRLAMMYASGVYLSSVEMNVMNSLKNNLEDGINRLSRAEVEIEKLSEEAQAEIDELEHEINSLRKQQKKVQEDISEIERKLLVEVVPVDCEKAMKHFKWIIDNGNPARAARLRQGYKQYMGGYPDKAVRNYLAAAETGSEMAVVNAAFLLERGECLGMNMVDCATASLRLWKAASEAGYNEASLRIGDFYYYGRFRPDQGLTGPFGWVQYLLYPERHLLPAMFQLVRKCVRMVLFKTGVLEEGEIEKDTVTSNAATEDFEASTTKQNDNPSTTSAQEQNDGEHQGQKPELHSLDSDLAMASRFYRLAADRSATPRAHFNMGFLYEWGLGLKQDFHLAKRHYDLAISASNKEAELPVTIALMTLRLHEYFVKQYIFWQEWLEENYAKDEGKDAGTSGAVTQRRQRLSKKMDVILKHLYSWDTAVILFLTLVLSVLIKNRRRRTT